ncbi:MAG: response regulator [Bdellovibrionota bacterium]|nr:MAG: response regulator [Bdellovibrionota bacterium]
MPDILAFGFLHNAALDRVADDLREDGLRFKRVDDFEIAREWLQLRVFDAVLVPAALPIVEQQELANLLWSKQGLARFIVVADDQIALHQRYEPRLMGAEVLTHAELAPELRRILKEAAEGAAAHGSSMKVCIVEDLDSPRDIICSFVESFGFRNVQGFSSAREVLDELRSHPNEAVCVVTDLKMPEFSGRELITEMRTDSTLRNIPIIVLTAHGTADSLIDCLKAGASGFLVKPPKKQDLLNELRRAQRIVAHSLDPVLATPQEAELLRDLLAQRGIL